VSTHHGILVHIVFSTKYRVAVLDESWRADLFAYIGGTVRAHKAALLEAGGIEDHIHLLMKFHPQFAISSTVQLLKANSSRWINENRNTSSRFQWQRGYGAFTVSQSMVATVKKYIANQREHHRTQQFEQEYLQLLRLHKIEFDERYVFEQDVMA
jgi:REP element-mobilizing transposase RayT